MLLPWSHGSPNTHPDCVRFQVQQEVLRSQMPKSLWARGTEWSYPCSRLATRPAPIALGGSRCRFPRVLPCQQKYTAICFMFVKSGRISSDICRSRLPIYHLAAVGSYRVRIASGFKVYGLVLTLLEGRKLQRAGRPDAARYELSIHLQSSGLVGRNLSLKMQKYMAFFLHQSYGQQKHQRVNITVNKILLS